MVVMATVLLVIKKIFYVRHHRETMKQSVFPVVVASLTTLVGLTGMFVYAIYTKLRGPIWIMNQFIGLWFFSVQSIVFIQCTPTVTRLRNTIDLVYYAATTIASILLLFGYSLGKRVDSVVWSVVLIACNSINIYCTLRDRMKIKKPSQFTNDFEEEEPLVTEGINGELKKKPSRIYTVLYGFNLFVRIVVFIFMLLLISGALTLGIGTVLYPPRGKFINFELGDGSGRTQCIHAYCDGPINDTHPTIFFEGDFAHGYADYLGLQKLLTERGRRSCSWDKIGLGFSDLSFSDQKNESSWYHEFIEALRERPPYVFVGWGGGSSIIYNYAVHHRELIHSLVLLDAYDANEDWITHHTLKNWTRSQYDEWYLDQVGPRLTIVNIINSIGVPFGIIPMFLPVTKTWPPEYQNERQWFYYTEKTWITQKYFMDIMYKDQGVPNVFESETLNRTLPVHLIISAWNDTQVIRNRCQPQGYLPDSDECRFLIDSNNISIDLKKKITNLNGGSVTLCEMDECNLGYFVYDGPQFTVSALEQIYANVTI